MNFDDKYPNTKNKQFLDNSLYKDSEEEQCLICQEFTQWRYFWSKRNSQGIPIMYKTYICSDECLEYYDIMKGLIHEDSKD